jgi:hypothetical protein
MGNRTKRQDQKVPGYVIEALAKLPGDLKPGTIRHVEVRHDSWCDLLNARGPCNCNPIVNLVRPS